MTNQTVLGKYSGTESVCKTCKHINKIEERFYCNLLGAFLAEQTLYIPCDFKEKVNPESWAVRFKSEFKKLGLIVFLFHTEYNYNHKHNNNLC